MTLIPKPTSSTGVLLPLWSSTNLNRSKTSLRPKRVNSNATLIVPKVLSCQSAGRTSSMETTPSGRVAGNSFKPFSASRTSKPWCRMWFPLPKTGAPLWERTRSVYHWHHWDYHRVDNIQPVLWNQPGWPVWLRRQPSRSQTLGHCRQVQWRSPFRTGQSLFRQLGQKGRHFQSRPGNHGWHEGRERQTEKGNGGCD